MYTTEYDHGFQIVRWTVDPGHQIKEGFLEHVRLKNRGGLNREMRIPAFWIMGQHEQRPCGGTGGVDAVQDGTALLVLGEE